MAFSHIKAALHSDMQTVWEIVTDVANYPMWRSDLSRTEIRNAKQFIEYTKKGYVTTFTVTVNEPYRRWEFDMENKSMTGHWIGIFDQRDGRTEIDFTENITARKFWIRPFFNKISAKTAGTVSCRFDKDLIAVNFYLLDRIKHNVLVQLLWPRFLWVVCGVKRRPTYLLDVTQHGSDQRIGYIL